MSPDVLERIAWTLIGLTVLDWLASAVMVYYALRLKEPAIEERATQSVILSLGATAVAAVAAAYLADFDLPFPNLTFFIVAFFALSIPQLIWSVAFLAGRFR